MGWFADMKLVRNNGGNLQKAQTFAGTCFTNMFYITEKYIWVLDKHIFKMQIIL